MQAEAAAAAGRAPYVMLVIPLLIEGGSWRCRVDRLLVIDCSPATQEKRVCARSRLEPTFVRTIIAQQVSRTDRLDAADDVLVNEGTPAQLVQRVQRLHHCYGERARRKNCRV